MAITTSEALTEAAEETELLMEATGEDAASVLQRQERLVGGDSDAWADAFLNYYAEERSVARLAVMGEVHFGGHEAAKKQQMTFRIHPHQRGMLKAVAACLGRDESWVLRWMIADRFLKMFTDDGPEVENNFPREWLADPKAMRDRLEELEAWAAARDDATPVSG